MQNAPKPLLLANTPARFATPHGASVNRPFGTIGTDPGHMPMDIQRVLPSGPTGTGTATAERVRPEPTPYQNHELSWGLIPAKGDDYFSFPMDSGFVRCHL